MVSIVNNFVFIHISKCAGVSIASLLNPLVQQSDQHINNQFKYDRATWSHANYMEYESVLKSMDKMLIFTVVRNPFDRILSLYSYWTQSRNPLTKSFINSLDVAKSSKEMDFNRWIDFIGQHSCGRHLDTQLSWLRNKDGMINPSIQILRFENLQSDMDIICDRLKVKNNIQHLNKSIHVPYQESFNTNSRDIIAKRFKEDLDYFNYQF